MFLYCCWERLGDGRSAGSCLEDFRLQGARRIEWRLQRRASRMTSVAFEEPALAGLVGEVVAEQLGDLVEARIAAVAVGMLDFA